jgi:hypothetical protein
MEHVLDAEFESADGVVFNCAQCGRRLVIPKPGRGLPVVIYPGDETVTHVGALGGLAARTGGAIRMVVPSTD